MPSAVLDVEKLPELSEKEQLEYGITTTRYGLVSLIFLALLKGGAWFLTGSVAMLADAVNSFTDIFGMLASYIGLSLSKKKAGRDFRYGYYKVESLAALLVSLFTIFLAYQVFVQSWTRLFVIPQITYARIGIIVALISSIISGILSQKLFLASRQINSPSLENNAEDKFIGIFTSLVVIIGIGASLYGLRLVEGLIGLGMSLIIFRVGLKESKQSLFFLLDYWDDPSLLHSIRTVLKKYAKMVLEVKKIRLRRSGSVIFGEVFLMINPFASIKDLRSALDNIERQIKALNPHFKDVVLYTVVPKPKRIRVAIPIKRDKGLHSIIALHFAGIKHFMFVDMVGNKIRSHKTVDFNFKEDQCHDIALYLKDHDTNILIAPDLPSLVYFELSSQMYFDVYPVFRNTKDVASLIKLLLIDT